MPFLNYDPRADPPIRIANLIGTLRSARGLSQRALGIKAGVAGSTVSRWESGAAQPSVAELKAVLGALDVAPGETAKALSLIAAPRALQAVREKERRGGDRLAETIRPPVGGDLLRALRIRGGWRQADVARAVDVPQSTIARWEASDAWPSAGRLHTLCHFLKAHPEEVAALTVGRFSLSRLIDLQTPEELHQELWLLLYKGNASPQAGAIKDLRFLALEARLHELLNVSDPGLYPRRGMTPGRRQRFQQILGWTYARHAQYLLETGRLSEVPSPAQYALEMHTQSGIRTNDEGWVPALIALMRLESQKRGPETRASARPYFGQLHRWLPEIQSYEFRAWAMVQMAHSVMLAGTGETAADAAHLSAGALEILEQYEGKSLEVERRLRRRDHAEILVATGRHREAARYLPLLDGRQWIGPGERNVRDLLVSADILLGLGDFAEMSRTLHAAYTYLDTLESSDPSDDPDRAATRASLREKANTLARSMG